MSKKEKYLSAANTHRMAEEYYEVKKAKGLDDLMKAIRKAAGRGFVDLAWDDELTSSTLTILIDLGYSVENISTSNFFEGQEPCYKISW